MASSEMELLKNKEIVKKDRELDGGGTLSRSRSQANKLAQKSVPFNQEVVSHASSLRSLAKRGGSRAMVSNSYRILDKNRVSHE